MATRTRARTTPEVIPELPISPEGARDVIERDDELRDIRDTHAREIFEAPDPVPSPEFVEAGTVFNQILSDIRDGGRGTRFSQLRDNERNAVATELEAVAIDAESYIRVVPELAELRRQARELAELDRQLFVFDSDGNQQMVAGTRGTRRRVDEVLQRRQEAFSTALDEWQEDNSMNSVNQQAVVDIILEERSPEPTDEQRDNHEHIMQQIEAADGMRGYARVLALGELAMQYGGQNHGLGDLGVIAAQRIAASENGSLKRITTRLARGKDANYYLNKIAQKNGNLTAALAITKGSYRREKNIFGGRNEALRTSADAKPDAEDILSFMSGKGAAKSRYEGYVDLAKRGEISTIRAAEVSGGLRNFYFKERAVAEAAVAAAKNARSRLEYDTALAAVHNIRVWRTVRSKALRDISKIQRPS